MNKIIIVFLFFLYLPAYAGNIGSDSAVTRFNTQQVLNNGDRVAAFAALQGGLAMASGVTFGTFDSFFPVSGDIGLNFGTLVLEADLIFSNVAAFTNVGNIAGKGHIIRIASSMSTIPTSDVVTNCPLSSTATASTTTGVGAQINSVDWDYTGTSVAIGMTSNAGNEVQVYSFNGTTLTSINGVSFGAGNVNSVNWHPSFEWLAVAKGTGAGTEVTNYFWDGSTLGTAIGSVDLGASSAFGVDWYPLGTFLAVATDVAAAHLRVYPVNSAGALGAAITITTTVQANKVSWNSDGVYLAVVTNATAGGALKLFSFNGVALAADAVFTTNLTAINANAVAWNRVSANNNIIAIGTNVNGAISTLRLFRFTPGILPAIGTLAEISTGVTLLTQVNSVAWRSDGSCLIVGLNSNAGTEINVYGFKNDTLTLQTGIERGVNIPAVSWSRNESYAGVGSTTNLNIYSATTNTVTNAFLSDVNIFLEGDTTFQDTSMTFSGQCSINGQGNTLTLSPTFSLVVQAGDSLLLQDVKIKGVSDSKMRCLSSLSTFSFQDVTLILDNDFTFTQGRMDILKKLTISGPGKAFIYSSSSQSTIRGGRFGSGNSAPLYVGTLLIDDSVTFSYVPSGGSSTLLNLESSVSKIILNSGTLFATTLALTKGILQIDGNSTLRGLNSITAGDGLSVANNLFIEIMPAAVLDVLGTFSYKNL